MQKNITMLDEVSAYLRSAKDVMVMGRVVSNWYDIVLFRLGIKGRISIRLRAGGIVPVDTLESYSNFYNSRVFQERLLEAKGLHFKFNVDDKHLTFRYKGKTVRFCLNEGRIATMLPQIIEQFVEDQYADLDIKGKNVVDIGTNIGDTAVYFALNGARKVFALEPFWQSYLLARRNVSANALSKVVVLLNEGCGNDGYMTLDRGLKDTVSASITNKKGGSKVRISSLKSIVERYGISNAVLKMDCEGCEYEAILNADRKTLSAFDEMSIEYHYGYVNLKDKLEKEGFRVDVTAPRYLGSHPNAMGNRMFVGLIHAIRL